MAMGLTVIILRLPVLTIANGQADPIVIQGRGNVVLLGIVQGLQINHGLDQGTDGPHRLQGPVEAGIIRLAPTHQGQHLALSGGDDHGRALQGASLEPAQLLQIRQTLAHGPFGLALNRGREGGEDDETLGAQVFLAIIPLQLPPYQVGEGGIDTRGPAALFANAQGRGLGDLGLAKVDDPLVGHDVDHQITPLGGPLGMTAGIVKGGPLDERDQQGRLGNAQLPQFTVVVETAGEPEAMDGAAAVLAQVDLVGVGLQDIFLWIAQLQEDGHEGLVDLPLQAPLVRQIKILDQLLGEGTAALDHGPGLEVLDGGPEDRQGIDADMGAEGAIFHGLEGIDKEGRQVRGLHQDPILVMNRVDAVDHDRIEPHQGGLLALVAIVAGVGDAGDMTVADLDGDEAFRLGAVPELEAPGTDHEVAIGLLVGARARRLGQFPVIQPLQLGQQLLGRQGGAGIEFQRARVHPGRQGPALTLELLPHRGIEGNGIDDDGQGGSQTRHQQGPAQEAQHPDQQAPPGGPGRPLVLVVILVVFVAIAPGHWAKSSGRAGAGIGSRAKAGHAGAAWGKMRHMVPRAARSGNLRHDLTPTPRSSRRRQKKVKATIKPRIRPKATPRLMSLTPKKP